MKRAIRSVKTEVVMREAALETIDEDYCLELLKRVEYGRVAVVTGEGRPEIFPVNFAVRGHTVVFITASAVIQAWAPLGHVAFEADCIDLATHEGWDVVVTGEGADISDARDPLALLARSYPAQPWAPGRKEHWIAILNPHFSGRRLYTPIPCSTYY
jgi:uncharacterized protein